MEGPGGKATVNLLMKMNARADKEDSTPIAIMQHNPSVNIFPSVNILVGAIQC